MLTLSTRLPFQPGPRSSDLKLCLDVLSRLNKVSRARVNNFFFLHVYIPVTCNIIYVHNMFISVFFNSVGRSPSTPWQCVTTREPFFLAYVIFLEVAVGCLSLVIVAM